MWSAGDIDITTSPAIFMKWPANTWIQIIWTTTGVKKFVQLQDVKWKSPVKVENLVEDDEVSEMEFDREEDNMDEVTEYSQRSRRREYNRIQT